MTGKSEGFYTADELPIEEYHRDPAVSQSGLKMFDQVPALYKAYRDGETDDDPSRGKFIGSAIHAAALEPDVFEDQYIVAPEKFDRRNVAGFKGWCEEQDPRKIILLEKDNRAIQGMHRKLHTHSWVGPRLRSATCEYSCFARDPETGLMVRVRFDMLTPDGWILDLKKTADITNQGITKAISNYGYFIQNALYVDAPGWLGEQYRPRGFVFVFVSDKPPYSVRVVFLTAEDIERGRKEYRRMLTAFAQCVESDHWPDYDEDPEPVMLTQWKRNEIDYR